MNSQDLFLTGTYNHWLVALSVVIAIIASYAALDLAGRVTSARGRSRYFWLTGGATAMGTGIWSMHYIGMLAFRMSVPVEYDWPTVLLSLLAAILASAIALFVVSRRAMGVAAAVAGSVAMGGGIAAMHYIGMAAMRMDAMCVYSAKIVTLSVVLAIVISFVALCLTFYFRTRTTGWGLRKGLSALVMGAAIPVMHYTGMAAASFVPATMPADLFLHSLRVSTLGIAGIALITFMVLGLVLVMAVADRRFSVQTSALESSERRYQQIVETALDAFIGMDAAGRVTDWNAQAERIFGWSKSEAIGKILSEFIIPEHRREAHKLRLQQLLESEARSNINDHLEMAATHRSGKEFPVELGISVIRTGATHSFAAFVRDVTDRARREEEREAAKLAAEAASRAKSEFLANMSHEIRTPLNGVMGMTDLVLDTDLTPDQRQCLETVKLSADSLLTVINDILDFSKIEAGKTDLEETDFDLRESLDATMRTLALRADEKGVELLCEVDPEIPQVVQADANRLRQIIFNLIGNAIKFTHDGEVALKVERDKDESGGNLFHFTVSDTGIGIPDDKLDAIFQPFAQADSSTTRRYGGTGLGLSISMRLVHMMGGKIWLESEVGKGSKFNFTVRLKIPDSQSIAPSAIASPDSLLGVKVLIVDDNQTNLRILEGMLTRWGMRTTTVSSGEQALVQLFAALKVTDPYALILTDMHMPMMNGFTLIERMRQVPEFAAATIMMLTSAGHQGDATRCKDLEVAAYLLKPIRQPELREAIARVLGARKQTAPSPLITRFSLEGSQSPAPGLRILLAEDNAVNRLLATKILEKKGHTVVATANGMEALAALEKDHFDLVLMDVQMPEMDGFDATAAIRLKEKTTGLHQPVVAMTAHAMKGDDERCLAAGMDGYLSKPIRQEELEVILELYSRHPPKSPNPLEVLKPVI
jgi:two-component system sensor histidine kinase/response regulator